MATITERKGRYLVRVRCKGNPTVSKTFTKRSDAAAWSRRVEADMESGRWSIRAAQAPTLRDAIREYRRVVAGKLKGAATYRYRFDEFENLPFATLAIDDIRPAQFADWRDDQVRRLKPDTVIRKLAMLSSIFTWAVKDRGWLDRNPLTSVRRPRAGPGRDRTLSDEERGWLLAAARSSKAAWLAPALTVFMTTAMRRGELWALRREDIDFDQATAHLRDTKNGLARHVPLSPDAVRALRELAQAAAARGDEVLLPVGPPGSISTRFVVTVRRAMMLYRDACESVGEPVDETILANVRLHDLRHHAVTTWASFGVLSVLELMAISGHKTTRMLARYTHLGAGSLAKKLATIESTRIGDDCMLHGAGTVQLRGT